MAVEAKDYDRNGEKCAEIPLEQHNSVWNTPVHRNLSRRGNNQALLAGQSITLCSNTAVLLNKINYFNSRLSHSRDSHSRGYRYKVRRLQ